MSDLSSLKVPSFKEVSGGDDPVLTEGEVLPVRWTAEMLAGLDWRKVTELARALAVSSRCEAGPTRITIDGMTEFVITQKSGGATMASLVRLAPWNHWMASGECVEKFAADLASHRRTRGVYLAPGGVSPAARIEASRRGIEVVDAEVLSATLNALPAAHSEFFHDITFSGKPFVPSCPVCLQPLTQSPETEAGTAPKAAPDIFYRTSDIVPEPVVARRLEIQQNCEVHFLREVRAKEVCVHGRAFGDFVCDGLVLLNPGAVLLGNVAARSVLVRPGAELRGDTRILKAGELGTVEKLPTAWLWTCSMLPPRKGCEQVRFLPH
jgi:hypothetical protein